MAIRTASSTRGRLPCSRFSNMSSYSNVVAVCARGKSSSEAGLGAISRVSGDAAGASGGGAANSAGSGGAGPAAGSAGTGGICP
eukprot:1333310-Pyramimonas_sp.AAC.1